MAISMRASSHSVAARRGAFKAAPARWAKPTAPVSRRTTLDVRAQLTLKDETSGVEWPVAHKFWDGEPFRCLGAATRSKKILMLSVKVYSAAAYVEADRCAKELGVRQRGGFFENDDDFCSAILDGAFSKALLIRLVRDVEGEQFADALNKNLVPRMTLAGELDKLNEFAALFNGKKLSNGTEVALLWNVVGDLEVLVSPPQTTPIDYSTLKPELRIRSIGLCRGLFEVFLGASSVLPEGRKNWAVGARQLLDSENVNRASRKQA